MVRADRSGPRRAHRRSRRAPRRRQRPDPRVRRLVAGGIAGVPRRLDVEEVRHRLLTARRPSSRPRRSARKLPRSSGWVPHRAGPCADLVAVGVDDDRGPDLVARASAPARARAPCARPPATPGSRRRRPAAAAARRRAAGAVGVAGDRRPATPRRRGGSGTGQTRSPVLELVHGAADRSRADRLVDRCGPLARSPAPVLLVLGFQLVPEEVEPPHPVILPEAARLGISSAGAPRCRLARSCGISDATSGIAARIAEPTQEPQRLVAVRRLEVGLRSGRSPARRAARRAAARYPWWSSRGRRRRRDAARASA